MERALLDGIPKLRRDALWSLSEGRLDAKAELATPEACVIVAIVTSKSV